MKYQKNVYRMLALFTQFTINMLVPIFMCSFMGYFIDYKAGTSCFFVILFFVGALAGFRNVYILAKRIYTDEDGKGDHDEKRE